MRNPVDLCLSCALTGSRNLKAREGIIYRKGDDRSIEALKTKFDDYCSVQAVPYEENPFFTCVERAGWWAGVQTKTDRKDQNKVTSICHCLTSFTSSGFMVKPSYVHLTKLSKQTK